MGCRGTGPAKARALQIPGEPMRTHHRARLGLAVLAMLALGACYPRAANLGPWAIGRGDVPIGMSPDAWINALAAHDRAWSLGLTSKTVVAVIDYSLPSSDRRLWVVDLASGQTLAMEHVAHGSRSGGVWATTFSNRDGSNQSSLGAFVTANRYFGIRGLSLRLRGLEPGINDRALARGIVLHGTTGVSAERARQGRMGRTEGCPAVSVEAARRLIPLVEEGVLLYVWAPDRSLLARSAFVDPGVAAVRLSSGL